MENASIECEPKMRLESHWGELWPRAGCTCGWLASCASYSYETADTLWHLHVAEKREGRTPFP